jgi:LuxR family maltose regulon positive regulatory protein
MQQPNFFLRTKLLPPRAVSQLLDRPRLTTRLQANLEAPMTMVAADAGSGKTTLIADFIRSQPRPSVWYQLLELKNLNRISARPFCVIFPKPPRR